MPDPAPGAPAVPEPPTNAAGLDRMLKEVDWKKLTREAMAMQADHALLKEAIVVVQGNILVLNAKLDLILGKLK